MRIVDPSTNSSSSANTCAILTPPGVAAIAVARLRGPGVSAFLKQHFSATALPGKCVHGRLADIDDPVVVLHSDLLTADVNLHGGTWIVHRFMELAAAAGFIRATDGGDGNTRLEREIWSALPSARTELALRALLAQEAAWHSFAAQFRDEPANRSALQSILEDKSLYWLLALPMVAIIGPANAGKSTLANQLFGQSRSIVADLPGTTRDWVGEIADVNGLAVMLVDTPGLRASTDPIEQAAIAASRGPARSAALRILVLDPTQPSAQQQRHLAMEYPDAIRIINKSDRPAAWDAAAISGDAIHTVAITGQGIAQLRAAIAGRFGCDGVNPARPRWWTARQRLAIQRAIETPGAISQIIEGED